MILKTIREVQKARRGDMAVGMRGRCFHCGDLLIPPIVFWNGNDGFGYEHPTAIALHTTCAQILGPKLREEGLDANIGDVVP